MSDRTHHVRLNITPFGHSCTVELDGRDISEAVRGLDVSAAVHDATSITLRLVVLDGVVVEGETRVLLPKATVEALCALGWTPPPAAVREIEADG